MQMARRSNGPWQRAGRPWWYVWHNGEQVNLGTDDHREAVRRWHKLLAGDSIERTIGVTVRHLFESYLDQVERTRSPKHYQGTRWRLAKIEAYFGQRAVESLTQTDVQRLLSKHPKWGPTTVACVLGALRAAL